MICPLLSMTKYPGGECQKEKCAWWVTLTYWNRNGEKMPEDLCAIKALVKKEVQK